MLQLGRSFKSLVQIIVTAGNKFYWDDCFSKASSLAYTTLFALVPVTALAFAMTSGFNMDEIALEKILKFVLPPEENELLVSMREQVTGYLIELGANVQRLGTASVAVLLFIGIALLNTIESALNAVWRVTSDKGVISKIVSFWAVITFGPILMGLSFYWYAKFGAFAQETDEQLNFWVQHAADYVVPVGSIWLALTLLYYMLPAARVNLRDAGLGALIGAILFEVVKRAFAYYLTVSTTYSAFYGALVSIPVFLFWIYLIWVVILFGAEISYQAGSIQIFRGLRKYASHLGEIGAVLGLRILYVIGERFVQGEPPPTESEIALESGSDPVLVRSCLGILSEAGLITIADAESHSRSLVLAPKKITFESVFKAFQSKRYRLREEEGDELNFFLDAFRETSLRNDVDKPIKDWTLADFLNAKAEE